MSINPIQQVTVIGVISLLIIIFGFYSVEPQSDNLYPEVSDSIGPDYWNEGLAEVSRYALMQNRYQDVHPGEVVMIFVKEDFLTDKQVKNESYQSDKSTPVLKNIQSKKFTTGLYDYTLSTNVFSPFDQKAYPGVLKTQCMTSEWCGVTYLQLNHEADKYRVESRSYFENEGDENYYVSDELLEDELFNLIRFDPKSLPLGNIQLIPSSSYSRLTHKHLAPTEVKAELMGYVGQEFKSKDVGVYQIEFQKLDRTKMIYYESQFPYKILGWDDTYPSMFDKKPRTTEVRLTHQVRNAYWKENKAVDAVQRESLGLNTFKEK